MTDVIPQNATVAYFSMEIALSPDISTYSGGLGVLSGDTLRAAADMGVPMVAVTLLHRKGYFHQVLDPNGNQTESPAEWDHEQVLQPLEPEAMIQIDGRQVRIRAWQYDVAGVTGHVVPVYLLDTSLPDNNAYDQTLTDFLYGGDSKYRLSQEAVLGIGGLAMLRALGYEAQSVAAYHMNEGHAALLCAALVEETAAGRGALESGEEDTTAVRERCVFTTHTPVPAGHDQFSLDLARQVLGARSYWACLMQACPDGVLNMTNLGLYFSRYVNGVAMRHGQVSQHMFPAYPINSITNGIHAGTWASEPFARLFDWHIPEWRLDNLYLRYAIDMPVPEIREAHIEAKNILLGEVQRRTNVALDPHALTIGFARRATPYKRMGLVLTDIERLKSIAERLGPIQFVFAGKAHPQDEGGKALIRRVHEAATELRGLVQVVYLSDYDWSLGKMFCSGVDLWLNTPLPPQEASGTSGMKAALNGVPSLSVLDGWWIEGHVEGVTGWAIKDGHPGAGALEDAGFIYDKLESAIMPLFYQRPEVYGEVMRWSVALNGSFFNAQRMLRQYLSNAYFPAGGMGSHAQP